MFIAGKGSKSGFEGSLGAFCSTDWSGLSTIDHRAWSKQDNPGGQGRAGNRITISPTSPP